MFECLNRFGWIFRCCGWCVDFLASVEASFKGLEWRRLHRDACVAIGIILGYMVNGCKWMFIHIINLLSRFCLIHPRLMANWQIARHQPPPAGVDQLLCTEKPKEVGLSAPRDVVENSWMLRKRLKIHHLGSVSIRFLVVQESPFMPLYHIVPMLSSLYHHFCWLNPFSLDVPSLDLLLALGFRFLRSWRMRGRRCSW